MKLAKMILTGIDVVRPRLGDGYRPAGPREPGDPAEQQLQQDQAAAAQPQGDVVGMIAEVREDSFSVRKDSDQSVVWFSITPELKGSYSAELVTGNHVRVSCDAGRQPRPHDGQQRHRRGRCSGRSRRQADFDVDRSRHRPISTPTSTWTRTRRPRPSIVTPRSRTTTPQIAQNDTDTSLREDSDDLRRRRRQRRAAADRQLAARGGDPRPPGHARRRGVCVRSQVLSRLDNY